MEESGRSKGTEIKTGQLNVRSVQLTLTKFHLGG